MNCNNSNNLPAAFCYEGKQVRTVNIDGKPWLVAKDVCNIFEIVDSTTATRDLDEDEKGTHSILTPGGMQNMTVINEFGLYKLTFKSRKPKAKEFTRWVTHEVLPEIMRTSRANFNAQEKIIDRAMDAKTDRDFQKVLALDLAFRKRTGFSALEAAGISINPERFLPEGHVWGDGFGVDWHFKRHLDTALILPYGEE